MSANKLLVIDNYPSDTIKANIESWMRKENSSQGLQKVEDLKSLHLIRFDFEQGTKDFIQCLILDAENKQCGWVKFNF